MRRPVIRTTVALDDRLVAEAQRLTGIKEKSALLREALEALNARESSRRLALLGGASLISKCRPGAGPNPRDLD